ncbi:YihY/virulence factor BrkB family protein [Algibacter lectus]|uniref:Ribonuclease BN n=1 Tax=Algibacter lectus TaxID=221126 RepID=A0A090V9N0_9FLAO|nr:YihY/virulence factor BrkB family protein [Algibacter lectus]GAL61525.1 ribonuclease BN [Algibacter lectus]
MEELQTTHQFSIKELPSLIKETYTSWMADDPFRLSAIVAYYTVLALPALLVIIINVIGAIWGVEIVQGQVTDEISAALGKDAASAIENIISETQNSESNFLSTVIGIGTLLFGATGVFYQLKISLNEIWKIKTNRMLKFGKLLPIVL